MSSAARALASRRRISSRVRCTAARTSAPPSTRSSAERERNDLGFAIVAGDGAHGLAQLLGIDVEAGQSGNAKQADVVSGGHDRVQAGKQVARFGSVGDVHALDDERNIGFGQFVDDVVAMEVRAVENAEVGPFAFRFSLRVANGGDEIGTLGVPAGENDDRDRRAGKLHAGLCGFLFARRLQRHTPVSGCRPSGGENGRILVDQREGAAKDRRGRTAILFEHDAFSVRESGEWKSSKAALEAPRKR